MSSFPNKCESCGGDLQYDPKTSSLKCQNCGNFVQLKFKVAKEQDYIEAEINEHAWSNEARTIKCKSCGAVDIMNKGDIADVCPFCGSNNIEDAMENTGLMPNGIMPFSISKEEALLFFKNKIKRSVWAPRDFKNSVKLDKIKSLYTPTFSFDTFAVCSYSGRLGKDETVRRRNLDGSWSTETETRWFNVSGVVKQKFDDVLIAAGQMISGAIIEQLEPYNTNASIQYDQAFLNGCIANSYKKDLKTSYTQATQAINVDLRNIIISRHNADRVASLDIDVDFSNNKYKYLLLPVYISGYRYNDKNYNIYVNGTTGKVAGKLPVSSKKVWGTLFGILLGVGAIIAAALLL